MSCAHVSIPRTESDFFMPTLHAKPEEKRMERRFEIFSSLPVAFYNNGNLFEGRVINLSGGGACLELSVTSSEVQPSLSINRTMECYVMTPTGPSKFRGRIQWHHASATRSRWGVSFIELSSWQEDPLRKIIHRPSAAKRSLPAVGMALY